MSIFYIHNPTQYLNLLTINKQLIRGLLKQIEKKKNAWENYKINID